MLAVRSFTLCGGTGLDGKLYHGIELPNVLRVSILSGLQSSSRTDSSTTEIIVALSTQGRASLMFQKRRSSDDASSVTPSWSSLSS